MKWLFKIFSAQWVKVITFLLTAYVLENYSVHKNRIMHHKLWWIQASMLHRKGRQQGGMDSAVKLTL